VSAVNRRQRRAQRARERSDASPPGPGPGEPVCPEAGSGSGLVCPYCRRFEVREHPSEGDCGHAILACCWCGAQLIAYTPAALDEGPAPPEFFDWLDGEIARIAAGGDPPPSFEGTREECLASMRAERESRLRENERLGAPHPKYLHH
jgi:hypothetical protein